MNITEDTFIALVTGNSKSSFVPGNGTKTKHVFLIIDHNSTVLTVTFISQEPEGMLSQTEYAYLIYSKSIYQALTM